MLSFSSVAGLVIQATGKTEFEDGLRPGTLRESCQAIPASALAHWSHLCCKTCVAMSEVWENPICLLGALSASHTVILALKWYRKNMSLEKIHFGL